MFTLASPCDTYSTRLAAAGQSVACIVLVAACHDVSARLAGEAVSTSQALECIALRGASRLQGTLTDTGRPHFKDSAHPRSRVQQYGSALV